MLCVDGFVQIPCIERNAMAAFRTYDAATLANVVYDNRMISLGLLIRTTCETGKDLSARYKETIDGGPARLHVKDFYKSMLALPTKNDAEDTSWQV